MYFFYMNWRNKPPLRPADFTVLHTCDGLDWEWVRAEDGLNWVRNSQLGLFDSGYFPSNFLDTSCYTSKLWVFVLSLAEQWDWVSNEDQAVEDSAEPQHLFLQMDPSHAPAPWSSLISHAKPPRRRSSQAVNYCSAFPLPMGACTPARMRDGHI